MNNLVVFSHKITAIVIFLIAPILVAQDRHKESFNVGSDVLVSVNTSHTDVIFETWSKDRVEVEAYIEGDGLSEKEKKEIFKNWNLDILGNSKKVVITSNKGSLWHDSETAGSLKSLESLKHLEGLESLKNMPLLDELGNMNWDVVIPDVPRLEKMPIWPFNGSRPNLQSGSEYRHYDVANGKSMTFDTGEYKKNKKAYVDKLNKKYNSNATVQEVDRWLADVDKWSNNIERVMEDWGDNFGREFDQKFGPEFERKMEKWGEEFGEKMEAWGENFGKEMEAWGENLGRDIEKWAEQFDDYDGDYKKEVRTDENGNKSIIIQGSKKNNSLFPKARKKLIIRMPKGVKTDINVRHGEVKMADAYNIRANFNYSSFVANSIDGGETLINASYAPVSINEWINGKLKVNYVEDCKINTVKNINLEANSCNVKINTVQENALLSGSFGNLFINDVSNNFKTIDVSLENTDATIHLPNTAFTFYFNGKKSPFSAPASLEIDKNINGGRVVLNGFFKSKSSKSLRINASYSNVKLQ